MPKNSYHFLYPIKLLLTLIENKINEIINEIKYSITEHIKYYKI